MPVSVETPIRALKYSYDRLSGHHVSTDYLESCPDLCYKSTVEVHIKATIHMLIKSEANA